MTDEATELHTRAVDGCPCRSGIGLRRAVATDVQRCLVLAQRDQRAPKVVGLARALLFYPSLYGVVAYRVSHAALHVRLPRPLNTAVYFAALLLQRVVILMTRVEISAQAHIGLGLLVNHAQGAVIGPVRAGSNLTVSHNVTLGRGARADADPDAFDADVDRDTHGGLPVLGDRVWLGVGAVVLGGITLGDDSMVGSNAVVRHDVPCRGVAVGVPAKVRSHQGSFGYVLYPGMEIDPERLVSYERRTTV